MTGNMEHLTSGVTDDAAISGACLQLIFAMVVFKSCLYLTENTEMLDM